MNGNTSNPILEKLKQFKKDGKLGSDKLKRLMQAKDVIKRMNFDILSKSEKEKLQFYLTDSNKQSKTLPISSEETHLKGVKIRGLVDDNGEPVNYEGNNKYQILINDSNKGPTILNFAVNPKNTQNFLKAFEKGGKFYKNTQGKMPVLTESYVKAKLNTEISNLPHQFKKKSNLDFFGFLYLKSFFLKV